MSPLVFEFLGAVLRWLLTITFATLVERHVITADQGVRFTGALTDHLLLYAPLLVPIAWSGWALFRSRLKLIAARELPAGASDHALAAKMNTISVKETITTP